MNKKSLMVMNNLIGKLLLSFLVFSVMTNISFAAKSGMITGIVMDKSSKEPLPGANVILPSIWFEEVEVDIATPMGASSNVSGEYRIVSVDPGTYTITISYIGYEPVKQKVTVGKGEVVQLDFVMEPKALKGETVEVTAQAEGQMQAINIQLNANTIKNVVSKTKIQELPEANAAEAVGRLPGISLQRDGGEGNKVVIRGLSPKYNKIQIEGVNMASTDNWDRSTDLSMVSPYILEGIEVTKAATADQEADQLGGTVNFRIKGAEKGLRMNALAQGGYSGLREEFGDYKFMTQVSNRFWHDQIGIYANIDYENRDRGSNSVSSGYTYMNEDKLTLINSLSVSDTDRDLKRFGGSLVLDYKTPTTFMKFSNIYSFINRETVNRYESTSSLRGAASRSQGLSWNERDIKILTNALRVEQYVGNIKISGGLSYTMSENDMPEELSYESLDSNPLTGRIPNDAKPKDIPGYLDKDVTGTILSQLNDYDSYTKEDEFSADFSTEWSWRVAKNFNVDFNTGFKYKHKNKEYDYNELVYHIQYTKQEANNAIIEKWPFVEQYFTNDKVPYTPFVDKDYDPGDFMAGDYSLNRIPKLGMGKELIHYLEDVLGINYGGASEPRSFCPNFHTSKRNDYDGSEDYIAGYFMPTLSFGKKWTFIPGVRYEHNETEYTGIKGNGDLLGTTTLGFIYEELTEKRTNDYVLPMIHLRFKPLDWFDVRASYTHTLARPSYMEFIPTWYITRGNIDYKNPQLEPSLSKNIDLYFSMYSQKVGLFTLGWFKKDIEDMVFWEERVILSKEMAEEDFNLTSERISLSDGTPRDPEDLVNRSISSYINNPNTVDVWGIETEWQSNFWFLPGLMKNIVLSVNYTHTFSEATYPRYVPIKETYMSPWGVPIDTIVGNSDESYKAPLIDQPDDIFNLTIGFDYRGFSIRGSMQYKSDIFSSNSWRKELRSYTDDLYLYDMSIKQQLPIRGMQFFCNFKNISKSMDRTLNKGTGWYSYEGYYGMTADFGIRYEF